MGQLLRVSLNGIVLENISPFVHCQGLNVVSQPVMQRLYSCSRYFSCLTFVWPPIHNHALGIALKNICPRILSSISSFIYLFLDQLVLIFMFGFFSVKQCILAIFLNC